MKTKRRAVCYCSAGFEGSHGKDRELLSRRKTRVLSKPTKHSFGIVEKEERESNAVAGIPNPDPINLSMHTHKCQKKHIGVKL
jgi:hypothetical protein